MMELTASKALRGEVIVPGDKSISHRSVMFGAIAQGTTEVTNFLQGAVLSFNNQLLSKTWH